MKILIEESTLRQALEALQETNDFMDCERSCRPYSDLEHTLRSALDAAEKVEPVGHVVEWLDGSLVHGWLDEAPPVGTPLYTTPPTNTDSELREAARAVVEHYKESHGEEWYGIDRLRKALK